MRNLCDWLPWAGKNALLQEDDHTNCLMKWYQSQQEKHLWPSCPHCRADPPSTVLEALLGVHPSPPTPFHWETAQNHIEYWNYTWDESIPIEREVFFLQYFQERLPDHIMLHGTDSGLYLVTFHRYENRRVSRFLAQNKREAIEAIRRFRFVLENLLDSLWF